MRKNLPQMHHHKTSGRARVYFRGKHFYLGKWGSKEANANYQSFLRQIHEIERPIVKGGGLPVFVCVEKYLLWAQEYYHGTGEINNLKSCLRDFKECFEWTPITEIGPLKIQDFMDELVKKDCTRVRVNKILGTIKRMYKYLISREIIGAEKLAEISAVRSLRKGRSKARELPPIEPVSQEIIEKTLETIRAPLDDMIRIQLLTAMRPNEICKLTFSQIDTTKKVWIYSPTMHKNTWRNLVRNILIGPEAQKLLAKYRFMPPDEPIFYTSKNVPFGSLVYGRAILEHCKRENIPRWSPNQLRHAAATRLVEQFGWEIARVILGHKTFNITAIYAKENIEKTAEIIGKIG